MRKPKLHWLTIKIFLFVLINVYSQTNYYVSTTGSNSNNGLTPQTAFQTLQYAVNVVTAGDSVLVLAGNYVGFDIRKDGSQNLPIVFKAIESNVVIDERNSVTPDGINIESADWIEIHGFNVINQPRAGIRIVLSDFVKIKNNICTNNYKWGIFTGFTNDILIEGNSCSYSTDEHGIYVSNSSDRPTIINNHSFNNSRCGIHMNGDISMGGDGIISNAVVAANILHDNGVGGGSAINMDGVQDSEIFNNLIYNNHATGIAMYKIDGGDGSKNNKVYNNTIIQPSDGRWNILVVDGSTGNTIYNNILISHHSFRGSIAVDAASLSGLVSDYNIVVNRFSNNGGSSNMTFTQWQALGFDLHSMIANPENQIFLDHLNGNFHLLQNAQAVDAGTSLVLPTVFEDLDKILRPQGNGFDIGCYEYSSVTSVVEEQMPEGFILYQNYPNPFNPSTKIKFTLTPSLSLRERVSEGQERVTLNIFDVLGNEVATIVDEYKPAGSYEVTFNSAGLSSGIYFYQLSVGDLKTTKPMLLIK